MSLYTFTENQLTVLKIVLTDMNKNVEEACEDNDSWFWASDIKAFTGWSKEVIGGVLSQMQQANMIGYDEGDKTQGVKPAYWVYGDVWEQLRYDGIDPTSAEPAPQVSEPTTMEPSVNLTAFA